MRTIRVLVADPQPLTRFATCELLRRAEDIIVVGDAGNAEDTIRLVKARRPEVVVFEMQLALPPGNRVLEELSRLAARILVLSNVTSEHHVAEALRYGAYGYLTKEATPEHILQAIRGTCNEKRGWFTSRVVEYPVALGAEFTNRNSISRREREILLLIADGYSTQEIANALSIAHKTVRNHMSRILDKMNAKTRAHAIAIGFRGGVLPISEEESRVCIG